MTKKILLIIMALAIMSFADCDAIAKKRVSSGKAKKTATTSKKKKSKKKNTQTESDDTVIMIIDQFIGDEELEELKELEEVDHVAIIGSAKILSIERPANYSYQVPFNEVHSSYDANEQIFSNVDQPAEFPGGINALMKFLSMNLRYPERAAENNIMGRVLVQFVVNNDGSIEQVEIKKGVDPDLDAEAIRVVKRMPRWTPGMKDGERVRCYFVLPIEFKLQE